MAARVLFDEELGHISERSLLGPDVDGALGHVGDEPADDCAINLGHEDSAGVVCDRLHECGEVLVVHPLVERGIADIPVGQAGAALRIEPRRFAPALPDWWRDAVLYTVFLDRFRRGGEPGTLPAPLDERGRAGGDLWGVREALPWLVEPPDRPYSKAFELDSIPRMILLSPEGKVLFNGHPEDPALWAALKKIDASIEAPAN